MGRLLFYGAFKGHYTCFPPPLHPCFPCLFPASLAYSGQLSYSPAPIPPPFLFPACFREWEYFSWPLAGNKKNMKIMLDKFPRFVIMCSQAREHGLRTGTHKKHMTNTITMIKNAEKQGGL